MVHVNTPYIPRLFKGLSGWPLCLSHWELVKYLNQNNRFFFQVCNQVSLIPSNIDQCSILIHIHVNSIIVSNIVEITSSISLSVISKFFSLCYVFFQIFQFFISLFFICLHFYIFMILFLIFLFLLLFFLFIYFILLIYFSFFLSIFLSFLIIQ